jgi:hypothetical protein
MKNINETKTLINFNEFKQHIIIILSNHTIWNLTPSQTDPFHKGFCRFTHK